MTSRIARSLAVLAATCVSMSSSAGLLIFNGFADPSLLDLNGDDVVDGIDIGVLLANWGPCS
jgi:hypothetical protein